MSVVVALLIGGIEIIGLLSEKLDVSTGPVAWIGGLDLEHVGYGIVALFVVTWAVALAVWHFGRIEERLSSVLERP